jgi:hypothetical protein
MKTERPWVSGSDGEKSVADENVFGPRHDQRDGCRRTESLTSNERSIRTAGPLPNSPVPSGASRGRRVYRQPVADTLWHSQLLQTAKKRRHEVIAASGIDAPSIPLAA